jgi:pyrroline-5-carboxylate reductase
MPRARAIGNAQTHVEREIPRSDMLFCRRHTDGETPMAEQRNPIGIVGGSGMLGSAIARALLKGGIVDTQDLWISNTRGTLPDPDTLPGVQVTSDNDRLADVCDTVILSIPPAAAAGLRIAASDRLVISVMAGVTLAGIQGITGSQRIVRAMSSPAAAFRAAYSPWVASPGVNAADRSRVTEIFGACGLTDEIHDEALLDHFTAMTGPVPGFVAFFANCMIEHAEKSGIPPDIAERAIRQLFLSAGAMLSQGEASPREHVTAMIDYAGTTAAGLVSMRDSPIAASIADGLEAAARKGRSMG